MRDIVKRPEAPFVLESPPLATVPLSLHTEQPDNDAIKSDPEWKPKKTDLLGKLQMVRCAGELHARQKMCPRSAALLLWIPTNLLAVTMQSVRWNVLAAIERDLNFQSELVDSLSALFGPLPARSALAALMFARTRSVKSPPRWQGLAAVLLTY